MQYDSRCARQLLDALAAEGRDHLVLCGIESHVCVLQTAATPDSGA